jgi:diaminopimelate epimerase
MMLSFSKYHGTGNDFILIDDRAEVFPVGNTARIRSLCDRRFGIGADGLVLLQNSTRADCKMRIFNADGGEPSMCGNGLRCIIHFLKQLGVAQQRVLVEVKDRLFACQWVGDKIEVNLGTPKIHHWDLACEGRTVSILDTGVPHLVSFVENCLQIDLMTEGKALRFHPLFAPDGVNVNFATFLPSGAIRMRTYERGVEGETLMCGTGAAAVAFAASKLHGSNNPISILAPQNTLLEMHIDPVAEQILMLGPATHVFTGVFSV